MQSIQSIQPAITSNYALQKRKPAAGNISMTGRKSDISEAPDKKNNTKRNIAIGAVVLAVAAAAISIVKFVKTKKYEKSMLKLITTADNVQIGRGDNALRLKSGKVVERVLKPRTTKAGQKALDAQAAINEGLKGYQYPQPEASGQVKKFMDRYCRAN